MADHFLGKIRVSNDDFVEADGTPVLERHDALRAMLVERAGPEVADMFAEPLISRGNDEAPPTVSWYSAIEGTPRPLEQLSPGERERAERYLADHLRPVRAMAEETGGTAGLAMGALTVYGANDVVVVGDRPIITNWGLMPDGKGANAAARPAHYAATLGRFLPLTAGAQPALSAEPAAAAIPVAAGAAVAANAATATPVAEPVVERERVITPLAWVPLLILLILSAATLAWLLMPGNRLFPVGEPPAVTDQALLDATRAETAALNARKAQLQAALTGAVCRADGQLILPGGRTPEGLLPPAVGVQPSDRAEAAPDALLPSRTERIVVPAEGNEGEETSLLDKIEARTVMVIVMSAEGRVGTGSGFAIGPGLIVTNYHVIAKALNGGQIIVTSKALNAPHRAEVLKHQGPLTETGGDFALIRIADTSLPAFEVHLPSESLKLTNVVAAGFPGDVLATDVNFSALRSGDLSAVPGMTVTDGIVNTEQQFGPATNVLMHSAALSSGNSGGPLIDQCGRLVGVNTFVRQGPLQNRGFALTTGDLMAFLNGTPASPSVVSSRCSPTVTRPGVAQAPQPADE
ncbi:MAG: S1C family serine protease [Arenibacterium sp.]